MEPALRPMSTAQVLDRTFHIYRSHFLLLAGIGALLPTLLLVLRLSFVPLGYPPRGAAMRSPFLFWSVFLEYSASWLLVYMIGHALTVGATVYAVSRLHLGQSVTIAECYRSTLPRFWSVLRIAMNIYLRSAGIAALTVLAVVLVALGGEALAEYVGAAGSNATDVLSIIVGVAAGVGGICWMLYIYARYCLAIPACVAEHLPARPALRRSRFLARESIRRITMIYLLMAVLGLVLSTVFWLPGQIYELFVRRSFLGAILLRSIGSFLAGVLAGPIATIAIALVYYDQRIRKEAFDLQFLMESLGQAQPEQPAPAPPTAV